MMGVTEKKVAPILDLLTQNIWWFHFYFVPLQCEKIKKQINDMKYKGYNIGKISRYIYNGYSGREGYYWNVNKDGNNRLFPTLREAKEWVNNQKLNDVND